MIRNSVAHLRLDGGSPVRKMGDVLEGEHPREPSRMVMNATTITEALANPFKRVLQELGFG